MKYIELNGLKLYLPSSVSVEKGKSKYDYSANWSQSRNGAHLKGNEYKFPQGSDDHKLIRKLVCQKYGQQFRPSANTDCKLIDEERVADYLNTPTPNCKITGVKYGVSKLNIFNNQITIDTFTLADKLGIQHKNILAAVRKYITKVELNPITEEVEKVAEQTRPSSKGQMEVYMNLNFRQALFVGTLSQNSKQVVEFKSWLTAWFDNFVTQSINSRFTWLPNNQEGIVQNYIVNLASKGDIPLKQEVTIDDEGHRVDLMYYDNSIAIELKVKLINPVHIRKTLFEKNYFHSLKNKFSNFQTLIFCSTIGISDDAKVMLDNLNPYVIYEDFDKFITRFTKGKIVTDYPYHILEAA
jgi:hypothetical protein